MPFLLVVLIGTVILSLFYYLFKKMKRVMPVSLYVGIIFLMLLLYCVRNLRFISHQYPDISFVRLSYSANNPHKIKEMNVELTNNKKLLEEIIEIFEQQLYLYIPEFGYVTRANNYITLTLDKYYISVYEDNCIRIMGQNGMYIPLGKSQNIFNALKIHLD